MPDEPLRPVAAVGDVADAKLRIGRGEDVGAVPLGVHPCAYDGLRRGIAHGDVLSGMAIGDVEGLHHIEGRAVVGAGVTEIAAVVHVLRLDAGVLAEVCTDRKRRQAIGGALGIDEPDDLLLIGQNAGHAAGIVRLLGRLGDVGLRRRIRRFGRAGRLLAGRDPAPQARAAEALREAGCGDRDGCAGENDQRCQKCDDFSFHWYYLLAFRFTPEVGRLQAVNPPRTCNDFPEKMQRIPETLVFDGGAVI